MDNPGLKNLGDVALAAINAATAATVVTASVDRSGNAIAYLDRLEGMLAALLSINFVYGSGGDTLKVIIETTADQGSTWTEVYRAAFTTASGQRQVNLSGLTPVAPYTPAALSDDAVKDGILGNWMRARILKGAGTAYAGLTSLSIRLHAR